MEKYESPLERFYHWEKTQPNKTFFRQAYQGQWLSVTWAQAGTEIRKMANYLKSLNFYSSFSNISLFHHLKVNHYTLVY